MRESKEFTALLFKLFLMYQAWRWGRSARRAYRVGHLSSAREATAKYDELIELIGSEA